MLSTKACLTRLQNLQVRKGIAKFKFLVLVTILSNHLDCLKKKCLKTLCPIYKYRYGEWKIMGGKKSFFNNCLSNIELMQRFILHFYTSLLLFFPASTYFPRPTSPFTPTLLQLSFSPTLTHISHLWQTWISLFHH